DGEGGFTLDEQVDGATEDFDFVQMNQLGHEYTSVPKVKQVKLGSTKQRLEEDENTKRYYGDDHYSRSTADSGGQLLARGLEHQMLHEIKDQGEVQDLIDVMKVMDGYPEGIAIRPFDE